MTSSRDTAWRTAPLNESRGVVTFGVICTAFLPLLACLGCVPVATMVGRPAAVLPRSGVRAGHSLGGMSLEQETASGSEILGGPELYFHYSRGLGARADVQVGGMVAIAEGGEFAEFWSDVRLQLLGSPYEERPEPGAPSSPFDLSVEAGLGGVTHPLGLFTNTYAGVNASFPRPGATPYLSYRRPWGRFDPDPGEAGRFGVDAVFLGVELGRPRRAAAVEVFAALPVGRSGGMDGTWRVWGVNLVLYGNMARPAPAAGATDVFIARYNGDVSP